MGGRTSGTMWISLRSSEILLIISSAASPVLSRQEQPPASNPVSEQRTIAARRRRRRRTHNPKAVVWYNPLTLSMAQVRISRGVFPARSLLIWSISSGVNCGVVMGVVIVCV